jgi:hypothetical protein
MATQDKSYRCGTCNAEFNSQEELDRHTRSAHKGASTESRSPGSSGSSERDREREKEMSR